MTPEKLERIIGNIYQELSSEGLFVQDYTGDVTLRFSKGGINEAVYTFDSKDNTIDFQLVNIGKVISHIHEGLPTKIVYEKRNIVQNAPKDFLMNLFKSKGALTV